MPQVIAMVGDEMVVLDEEGIQIEEAFSGGRTSDCCRRKR